MTPPPQGSGIVTTKSPPDATSVHSLSTGLAHPVDKSRIPVHRFWRLSTKTVDNSPVLWINRAPDARYKHTIADSLWITLWIRGVKTVDNPVDDFVDSGRLWISRGFIHRISTGCGGLSTALSTGRSAGFALRNGEIGRLSTYPQALLLLLIQ